MINESLGASASEVAERLALLPHPDGGWTRDSAPDGAPIACSLRLLTAECTPRWERASTTAAWFWHGGAAVEVERFDLGAPIARDRLGAGDDARPQLLAPAYAWQRHAVREGWALLGIATPGHRAPQRECAPADWAPGPIDPRFSPWLDRAITELGAESGSIHLLLDDGVLHLICSKGIPDPVLAMVHRVAVGKGMAGHAVERRGPVTACNIQTDRSGDVRPGALATGLEGAIVVPIFDERDGAVGALGVANRAARTFTPQETVALIDLGRRVASARLGR